MINLSYTVAGQLIEPASVPQYLVADTVGVYQVAFTFDADWADMGEKMVVFRNPQVIDPDYRDVPVEFPLDANGQALVPAALLDPGKLFIGVYGTNSTQQFPTIWAPPLQVVPGASPGVEPSDDPALGTVIRTIPQTLTEEEKAQARENIGANEVEGGTPGNVVIIDNNLNIADSGLPASTINARFDDVISGYTTLPPYLYKRDTCKNASHVDTELVGFDLFYIPLHLGDILHITWTPNTVPWSTLSAAYAIHILKSDDTYLSPTFGANQFGYYAGGTVGGSIFLGVSDFKGVYFSAKQTSISDVKISVFNSYVQTNERKSQGITLIDKNTTESTAVCSPCFLQTNNAKFSRLSGDYVTTYTRIKTGDKVVFNGTVTGVSYRGVILNDDGTNITLLNTWTEYTAVKDGIMNLFGNRTQNYTWTIIPAETVRVLADHVYGLSDLVGSAFNGVSGVAFGTSLTYRSQTTGGFLTKLSELSGITFDNQGIGSSSILGNMLTAIKGYTGYAGKRVCTLEGFVNDWYGGNVLGTYTDTGETTVCGCVRSAINYILSQNASITVFLILDHYGRLSGTTDCSTSATNPNGLTQYQYYEEIAKVAESLGIPVIKEYKVSQISENTPQYLLDNIHCNALGAVQSAYAIWSQMRNYYPNQI